MGDFLNRQNYGNFSDRICDLRMTGFTWCHFRRRGVGRGESGDRLPGMMGVSGGGVPTGFPSPSGDYPAEAGPLPGGPHAGGPPAFSHPARGGHGHNSLPRPPGPRRRQGIF